MAGLATFILCLLAGGMAFVYASAMAAGAWQIGLATGAALVVLATMILLAQRWRTRMMSPSNPSGATARPGRPPGRGSQGGGRRPLASRLALIFALCILHPVTWAMIGFTLVALWNLEIWGALFTGLVTAGLVWLIFRIDDLRADPRGLPAPLPGR